MDDMTRQVLKRAHWHISEGRWTQGPLFDGHGYCLLGSVGLNPRAVDEIAKVLRFRRFKGIRIAIWNDWGRRRRSEDVAAVLHDALSGLTVCRTTGTAIDDLDLRPPHLRPAADVARISDCRPIPLEPMTASELAFAKTMHKHVSERHAAMVASEVRPEMDAEPTSGGVVFRFVAAVAAITGSGPRIAF